jgi:hypothetical protein
MRYTRFTATWLVLIACATVLAGCGERVPPLSQLDGSAVVLAFGDSLTYGTGASTPESYPAVLERLIGRKVVAAGIPGEVSATELDKLPETQAAANVRAMVKLARDKGVDVVLLGVPKLGLTAAPAGFYADIAREFRIPYDGEVLKQVLTDNALKSDWVHPNAKGYARIAGSLAELLKRAKAI